MTKHNPLPPASAEIAAKLKNEFEQMWRDQPSYKDADKEVALKWFLMARQSVVIPAPKRAAIKKTDQPIMASVKSGHNMCIDEFTVLVVAQGYQVL